MTLSKRIKVLALLFGNAAAVLIVGLFVMSAPAPAMAGTTIDDAVILDPYDPTPGIGFGCDDGCGYRHCYSGCARHCYNGCRRSGCYDGCRTSYRCERGCYRHDCDRDCGRRDCGNDCRADRCDNDRCFRDRDNDGSSNATPCTSDHCYNAERWDRRWRDGDRAGHEWYNAGSNQRDKSDDHPWEDGRDGDWDDRGPPPQATVIIDDHHDDHGHHDHH